MSRMQQGVIFSILATRGLLLADTVENQLASCRAELTVL